MQLIMSKMSAEAGEAGESKTTAIGIKTRAASSTTETHKAVDEEMEGFGVEAAARWTESIEKQITGITVVTINAKIRWMLA